MQYVVMAVPVLVFAAILGLISASVLRRRGLMQRRPARPGPARPRPAPKPLLYVSRDQMDDDLKDLIRRS